MADPSSLKSRNLKYLAALLAVDLAIVTALGVRPSLDPTSDALALPVAGLIAVIAALVLSWLIPADIKHTLIHWRTKHVLPGHRAFSELARRDSRIDIEALQALLGGELPVEPERQDRVWFKLYKSRDSEPAIAETHQRVLFFRDAAAISFLICILEAAIAIATWHASHLVASVIFVFQYLTFMVAGRHAGERLVQSVLASASAAEQAGSRQG